METLTDFECNMRILLLSLGFSCLYGSLFIKTWRIAILFREHSSFSIFSITLKKLIIIFIAMIFIDIIIILLLLIIDPFESVFISPDPERPVLGYHDCIIKSPPYGGYVLLSLLGLVKIALLIFGIICTFLIRKVKFIHLNESKWIAYSIYNLFFCIIIIVILLVALQDYTQRELLFVLRSILTLFSTFTTSVFLFIPKFYYYIRGKDTSQRVKHSNDSQKIQTSPKGKRQSSSKSSVSSTNFETNEVSFHLNYVAKERKISKLEKAFKIVRDSMAQNHYERRNYKKIEAIYLEKIMQLKEN